MRILEELRKIFSEERRRKTIILCPRCGSPNIRLATKLSGWITPRIYVCEKCGYTGPIYLEVDLEEYKKRSEISSE